MIRRDYFLRMIEEFMQVLARLQSLKKDHRWEEADLLADEQFRRLVSAGADEVSKLSETELLARVIRGDPTPIVHGKTLMLTSLLNEAGEVAAAQGRTEESRALFLKGLHLLLQTIATGEPSDFPDFVPRVEVFLRPLQEQSLPLATQAMLMQHYERTGEFAKAEDYLFRMLETDPANPKLLEFGIAFYERLQTRSGAQLSAGNLPRAEVDAALAELRERVARV